MRRFTPTLILLSLLSLLPVAPAMAGLFGGNNLVTIDDNKYTADDYKLWWKFWNEEKGAVPESLDPYIDWMLLSREGERMDLASDPGFKRQTRIFLQSRTLLMLKHEAVNSKIKVTDADVKKYYDERFQPRWLVQQIKFENEAAALAAWQEVTAKKVTVKELLTRKTEAGGPESVNEKWVRPNKTDPGWVAIFKKVKAGEVVDPSAHEKGSVLFFMKDMKPGDKEDFASLREDVKKALWKEQESALTSALLKELRKKYQVKVDEKRLAAMDIRAADDTFTDEPVITSTQQNVSEKQVIAVVRRLVDSRPAAAFAASKEASEEEARDLKNETVNNIIAQSVTNWESLDRHFENKEPFKLEYDFNFRHRLTLALEARLFHPEAKVTDEEITKFFQQNKDAYIQPTMVKLYILDEKQGPIDRVWADVAVGEKFELAVKKHFGVDVQPQEAPANHLDPEVKAVVEKLAEGETSQIFTAQGIKVLAHLVERTPEAPLPLARVKESISNRLKKEKFNTLRRDFLNKLKSQSKIEVSESKWKAVQKDITAANKKALEEEKKQKELEKAKEKEAEAARRKEAEAARQREVEAAKQKELGGKK